jgi:hypothetical protein
MRIALLLIAIAALQWFLLLLARKLLKSKLSWQQSVVGLGLLPMLASGLATWIYFDPNLCSEADPDMCVGTFAAVIFLTGIALISILAGLSILGFEYLRRFAK